MRMFCQDIWVMGKAMCLLVPFIELTVSHTSVLTILAITVERYYAVCLPLRAGLIWTKNKAGLVCLVRKTPNRPTHQIITLVCAAQVSWLLSVILTSPVLAISNYQESSPGGGPPTCQTDVDPPWTKVKL